MQGSSEGEPLLLTASALPPPGQHHLRRHRHQINSAADPAPSSHQQPQQQHSLHGHSKARQHAAPGKPFGHISSLLAQLTTRSGRSRNCLLLPLYSVLPTTAMAEVVAAPGAGPVFTARAVAAGLLIGAVLCFSNTYFGLQTGWVTMGSLQSAILGYGLFQGLGATGLLRRHLNAAENVIVQTTAVATATMPLAAGLVGIIPALGLLTPEERPAGPVVFSTWQLLAWCSALAFFGVFVAVPLRKQTIIREKLRFPSGTATASVIRTLHGLPPEPQEATESAGSSGVTNSSSSSQGVNAGLQAPGKELGSAAAGVQQEQEQLVGSSSSSRAFNNQVDLEVAVWAEGDPEQNTLLGAAGTGRAAGSSSTAAQQQQWRRALQLLLWCFALSGAYSLAAAWIKPLKVLKVFNWLHLPAATAWGWVLQPSAGYIGQGMIMGPKTACSMMAGAITGWAVLGPMVKAKGWAPGPIKDVETGAAGWLMWLGLALLLGDCFSELALLIASSVYEKAAASGWFGSSNSSSRGLGGAAGRAAGALGGSATSSTPYHLLQEQGVGAGVAGGAGAYTQQQQGGLRSRQGSRALIAEQGLELSPHSADGSLEAGSAGGSSKAQPPAASLLPGEAASQHLAQEGGSQQPLPAHKPTEATTAAGSAYAVGGRDSDAHAWLLTPRFWVPGLLLSTALATGVLSPMLGMPVYEPLVAVLVALLVALLAVRALGQTDLNPVSGVGKVSQLVFAVVSPGAVLPNLVAGAIAEAGAQQAGDLMQDFKTAHLLHVAPSSQLLAMLLGSAASVPLSVAAYQLYTTAYQVPGPELPAPTAQIWLDMAKLVNGGQLPQHIGPFCAAAAAIAAALPVLQLLLRRVQQQQQQSAAARAGSLQPRRAAANPGAPAASSSVWRQAAARLWLTWRSRSLVDWVLALLPSGVGFAVGCYLTPNWTLPRFIGSMFEQAWLLLSPETHAAFMMVTASGLVLGEGCASVVTAVVQAALK